MKTKVVFGCLLGLLLLLISFDAEAQCAMCKAVVESNMGSGDDAMGKGINSGIIYIMFVPYLLIGIVGFFAYKHYIKTNKASA